ncbi:hypothetical protein H7H80_07940 [Mycobacterium interjectum]|nr:hypothetical protein [Mycobacterium interjectum]
MWRRFCEVKQWRGLTTRYEKTRHRLSQCSRPNAVVGWARQLSDTP